MALKNYRDESTGMSQTKKLVIALVVLAVLAVLVNFVIIPMMNKHGL
jgi:hypothetical protein